MAEEGDYLERVGSPEDILLEIGERVEGQGVEQVVTLDHTTTVVNLTDIKPPEESGEPLMRIVLAPGSPNAETLIIDRSDRLPEEVREQFGGALLVIYNSKTPKDKLAPANTVPLPLDQGIKVGRSRSLETSNALGLSSTSTDISRTHLYLEWRGPSRVGPSTFLIADESTNHTLITWSGNPPKETYK